MADGDPVAILIVRVQLGDGDPHPHARVTWLTDIHDAGTQSITHRRSRQGISHLVNLWLDLIGMPRDGRDRVTGGGPEPDP